MGPQRLDITLAFKAISLCDGLTGTDKQVAGAIIDSFNYHTKQCDPSFDRIAHLVGRSRRTIIRSVQRLERIRFLTKIRHGGHYHRNLYQPNWLGFRHLEASWKARKATRHWGSDMTPSSVPASGHTAGDETGTQTSLINQSNETSSRSSTSVASELPFPKQNPNKKAGSPWQNSGPANRCARFTTAAVTDSAIVARFAAERRWNNSLLLRFRDRPKLYAQAVELIDPGLQEQATDAELKRNGAGLAHIIHQLTKRGLDL